MQECVADTPARRGEVQTCHVTLKFHGPSPDGGSNRTEERRKPKKKKKGRKLNKFLWRTQSPRSSSSDSQKAKPEQRTALLQNEERKKREFGPFVSSSDASSTRRQPLPPLSPYSCQTGRDTHLEAYVELYIDSIHITFFVSVDAV